MSMPKRVKDLYALVMDFIKKCNDDHVAAFGSMSAFFMLLSLFPFLIFFLTLTKIAPFSKEDIQFSLWYQGGNRIHDNQINSTAFY